MSHLLLFHVFFSRVVPNCVTKAKNVRNRIFVADQIDECKDQSGLYYLLPFQKVAQQLLLESLHLRAWY